MEIFLIKQGHPLWEKTISFAQGCSWKAGPALARRMSDNDFSDPERVVIAVEHGSIAGFCTFSEKDELPDGCGYTPFIGFVFVDERYRGKRLSGRMIDHACAYAKELGCQAVYIMSGEHGLYEKYGFEKIGEFETIYGTTDGLFMRAL